MEENNFQKFYMINGLCLKILTSTEDAHFGWVVTQAKWVITKLFYHP